MDNLAPKCQEKQLRDARTHLIVAEGQLMEQMITLGNQARTLEIQAIQLGEQHQRLETQAHILTTQSKHLTDLVNQMIEMEESHKSEVTRLQNLAKSRKLNIVIVVVASLIKLVASSRNS